MIGVNNIKGFYFPFWFGLWCLINPHFQQYFSYIVVVSFIGGGNRIKQPTCRTSLTHFIT